MLFWPRIRKIGEDSADASLASVLRAELEGSFLKDKQYPATLAEVWTQQEVTEYRAKYNVSNSDWEKFEYTCHGNWYELSFTNFGSVKTIVGSNGIVIH